MTASSLRFVISPTPEFRDFSRDCLYFSEDLRPTLLLASPLESLMSFAHFLRAALEPF